MILEEMVTRKIPAQKTQKAVCQLEGFFEFILRNTIPPYPFSRKDEGFSFEDECFHYLEYYFNCTEAISVEKIVSTASENLLAILIEKFRRWIPDSELVRFYQEIKKQKAPRLLSVMRTVFPKLACLDYFSHFTVEQQIPLLYSQISGIYSPQTMYTEMMPVLRALMLRDLNDD